MAENRYSNLLLSENPFPIVPIPSEHPSICSVHQDALFRIIKQVNRVVRTNRPAHMVLVGPYGSGKTHLLRYLMNEINSGLEQSFAAYVPHPGSDIISIYRSFIDNLGYERLLELASTVKEKQLKKTIIYHDFVTALAHLNDPIRTFEAWRWLTANNLTLEERRALRVAATINRNDEALNAFSALLKFLISAGYKSICILIDEFEEINSLIPLRKRRLFNDLRHLIDSNVSNFSLIIACTPHGWETVYAETAPLVRRFSSNVLFLEPLNDTLTINLITQYLETYRLHDSHKLSAGRSIHPFTPDAIQTLLKISRGNTGEILKYSGIAIEQAADAGFTSIDCEVVEKSIACHYGKTL